MSAPRLPVARPARKRAKPQTYTPEVLRLKRARAKAAYEARKAAGLCVYTPGCGNRTDGTVYCDDCRAAQRAKREGRRAQAAI